MIVKVDICDDAGPAHETGPWADIARKIHRPPRQVARVAILNRGTVNGRPSVLIASPSNDDDDDSWEVTEITGDMWEAIAGAIRGARARWGVEDRP